MASKIQLLINDTNTPEAVKKLLEEFVTEFNNNNSEAWIREIKQHNEEYHRKTILKQGRCDFDNPTNSLTSEEFICLYNYYYFPMHFQSSFWLYNQLFQKGLGKVFITNNAPFFLDFGCGSLSSTIAFASVYDKVFTAYINSKDFVFDETFKQLYHNGSIESKEFSQRYYKYYYNKDSNEFVETITENWILLPNKQLLKDNIGYLFTDKSINILKFTEKYHSSFEFPYIDYDFWTKYDAYGYYYAAFVADNFFVQEGDKLNINFIREIIEKHLKSQFTTKGLSIIINFSYVFASTSLNINQISGLIKEVIQTYYNIPICIINQNPDLDNLNIKWEEFKQQIPLKSVAKGAATIQHFGSSKVRYEVLYKSKFDDVFSIYVQ